ncbi:MAG: PKD domain-containing protein, partial [Kiritimatiellae bacterium]|nr:PKD domain-containing protein [Kiritimatiellia bacterium]
MNLTRSMLRQLVVVIVVVGLLANVCADTNYMTTDNDSGDLAILSTIAAVPFLDNFEADVLSNVWNVSLSPSGIVCRGSAGIIDNELRLTSHGTSSQCGFAWNSEKQTVVHGFTNTFVFRIDLSYVWQREGFAFVIQNDDLFVGLEEITGGPGYENIENCIAIEFDTYGYGSTDPNSQHIGILTRGTLPASYDHTNALGAVTNLPPLNDGQIHTARVDYVSGSMDVYLDDMSTPILSVSVDLDSTLNLDNGKAWVGFTASAGDQSHNILSWDFTSISNQFSYQSFTNYRGRVAITNLFDPIEGTRHVVMDNYSSSTLPCLNNLDLSIDLSGQSNVWLKYWWKPYGDYTDLPVEYSDESYVGFYEGDGVAASTDNVYWYSMSSLECYNTSSNGYIESYIYLDDYINKLDNDPLGWSSNFCVRFQQYGAGIIPEEGIVLDSVSIYHAPPPVAQFPFEDGFEHGVKHAWWGNRYPLPIKGANYSHSGDFSRGCMNGTTFSDIMTIDLSGQSNVWLSFWCRNQNDNLEYIMPSSFSGDIEADGVSISVDDGSTWYKVQGLTTGEGSPADDSYHLFNINLDLVLSAQGLSFVSNTLIQFEFMQREYHRRYLDDISILSQEFVLSSPTYSAYEGATALIPVIRKGSSSGNVSVDYSTYDQAAAGGSDYAVQNGTLLFGDGVTSLNIEVPIYDDTEYYEPSETFLIAISNATGGAELGSLISATVEIAADPRAPFPFIEGFEFETAFWLTDIPYWRREGRSDGYYVLLGSSEYPHSGGKSLQLRYSGGGATNWGRATVTVNMMEKTNVVLRFWHRTFDQHDAVMPASFIGTNFSDGVAISADGTNWYKASGLTLAEGSSTNYMQHEISLDPILSANGISYNKNFKICFQVYDYSDFEASFVGSVFDDVAVFSVAEKLDVVNVSLPSGTSMVAYATQLIGTNGVPPYTFSTTSTLPQGISLSLDGQLSGLPGDEGTFPVDLQLVDQTDSLTNKVLNLIINANPNRPPVITSTNPLPLVVVMPENTNISFNITAIDPEGTNLVYHWSLDENTVGLDSSSYVLNTIWGDAGDYTLRVTVTDGLWQYIDVQWNISVLSDNDDDGMPNLWENQYGLDPWHATDATDDPDNDNLVNLQEYHNGTDPLSKDTDGDTLPDGWEVQENMNPVSVTNNLPDVRLHLLGSKDYGSFTYDIDIQESFVYMATSDGLICTDISDP